MEEPCEIVIVVSPRVAIMREQVKFLTEKGLKAVYISEENCDLGGLQAGNYNYVYGSPEVLMVKQRKLFTSNIYRKKLCAVFIDESHSILKWQVIFLSIYTFTC